jgi:cyclic pyranopterin phosphate synthase
VDVVADSEGRVIDRLRLSVTDRCDQRCSYCMPPCGVEKIPREELLTIEEMAMTACLFVQHVGIRAIRLTGGEPLLRAGVLDLVGQLASLGLDDLAMTTNGQMLERLAGPLADKGLMRVNVSLDSLDPSAYERITRGGDLQRTLDGIRAALSAGLTPLKVNTVVLRGVNDNEIADIASWGVETGVEVRFLELMPIGVALPDHEQLFVPATEIISRLKEAFALTGQPVETTSTAKIYEVVRPDGITGRIGVISPQTDSFCARCRRLRLTTTGRLLTCLHADRGVDLAPLIRAPSGLDVERFVAAVLQAVADKPACRPGSRRSSMHAVGG